MSYFKIKLLTFFAISSLFIMPIYGDQALSKEELQQQIKLKEERIDVLSEKISKLENSLFLIMQKMKTYMDIFKEAKKQQLLKNNPKLKNVDEEIEKIWSIETTRFVEAFQDINCRSESQIVNGKFFEEGLDGISAFLLRLFLMRMAINLAQLQEHSAEWEKVIKEAGDLTTQLKSI